MSREAITRVVLYAADAGGLRQPLTTPTPSLVFRPIDGGDIGLVGVIHVSDDANLVAGAALEARVVFPLDDSDPYVAEGQRFFLWNGRVVGTADVLSVRPTT